MGAAEVDRAPRRELRALPKAHLHLHFTGSMRHQTLVELAERDGIALPEALLSQWPPQLSAADEKGWFRFQRLYDLARSVLRTEDDVRRLLLEAALDERGEGSGWLELQVDPSGYALRYGGLSAFLDLVLDAAGQASRESGVGIGIIVAANRTRHPLDARTLARLAAQYAGRGVVGFGLSGDERRGQPAEFARAFAIAHRAGLLAAPHSGELCPAASVSACVDSLSPHRVGHGVRAVEDGRLLERIASAGVTLEVCPTSNVGLGVYADPASVPLRALLDAGVSVALGADDPLLFGHRLLRQYEIARDVHGLADTELATLASMAVRGSAAPSPLKAQLLQGIRDWCAT